MRATTVQSHQLDGFDAVTLRNADIEITVVPSLGARIVSLRSTAGGREWMWRPADARGLFSCSSETLFEHGPLAGADECLPTILPCELNGVAIPDHGELWMRSWEHAIDASQTLVTSITLQTLPLRFERRLTLDGKRVRLDYRLTNTSTSVVRYLWAFHPMFTWHEGDRIQLSGPAEVTVTGVQECVLATGDHGPWPSPRPGAKLDRGEFGSPTNSYCKAFLPTARAPSVQLIGRGNEGALTLTVDPRQVPMWGYWLSRGGWFGHHHVAIEPTSAPYDGLTDLPAEDTSGDLAPSATRAWTVELTLDK